MFRYEPYLWENEKQSYLQHAILFGCFVQLRRMYTATTQKFPTNSESNIMRCSMVPRFKYLPIRLILQFLAYLFTQKVFQCHVIQHTPIARNFFTRRYLLLEHGQFTNMKPPTAEVFVYVFDSLMMVRR